MNKLHCGESPKTQGSANFKTVSHIPRVAIVKVIIAVIQPFMLDRVVRSIRTQIEAMHYWEVEGFGAKVSHAIGDEEIVNYFSPRIRMELVVEESNVDAVMHKVRTLADTGENSDSDLFLICIDGSARI
jgi:nitrogen regulatory protein P-II 1